jgi:type IV pilus assembly protein PilN
MRVSINLATRPFVELRPLFARLRIGMAALAVLAVALGIGLRVMSRRVNVAEAHMRELKVQTSVLDNERHANETRMRQPDNQAVLERSRFLNDVFQRKSFSWTAVMMDLENVLPAGVQVTSIEPVITPDGDVNIRLRVSGDRDREVDLVRNLERSQRFVSPRLVNESAQSQEQGRAAAVSLAPGAVEFDILSGYNPLPTQKTAPQKHEAAAAKAPKAKTKGRRPDAAPKSPPAAPGAVNVAPAPINKPAAPAGGTR